MYSPVNHQRIYGILKKTPEVSPCKGNDTFDPPCTFTCPANQDRDTSRFQSQRSRNSNKKKIRANQGHRERTKDKHSTVMNRLPWDDSTNITYDKISKLNHRQVRKLGHPWKRKANGKPVLQHTVGAKNMPRCDLKKRKAGIMSTPSLKIKSQRFTTKASSNNTNPDGQSQAHKTCVTYNASNNRHQHDCVTSGCYNSGLGAKKSFSTAQCLQQIASQKTKKGFLKFRPRSCRMKKTSDAVKPGGSKSLSRLEKTNNHVNLNSLESKCPSRVASATNRESARLSQSKLEAAKASRSRLEQMVSQTSMQNGLERENAYGSRAEFSRNSPGIPRSNMRDASPYTNSVYTDNLKDGRAIGTGVPGRPFGDRQTSTVRFENHGPYGTYPDRRFDGADLMPNSRPPGSTYSHASANKALSSSRYLNDDSVSCRRDRATTPSDIPWCIDFCAKVLQNLRLRERTRSEMPASSRSRCEPEPQDNFRRNDRGAILSPRSEHNVQLQNNYDVCDVSQTSWRPRARLNDKMFTNDWSRRPPNDHFNMAQIMSRPPQDFNLGLRYYQPLSTAVNRWAFLRPCTRNNSDSYNFSPYTFSPSSELRLFDKYLSEEGCARNIDKSASFISPTIIKSSGQLLQGDEYSPVRSTSRPHNGSSFWRPREPRFNTLFDSPFESYRTPSPYSHNRGFPRLEWEVPFSRVRFYTGSSAPLSIPRYRPACSILCKLGSPSGTKVGQPESSQSVAKLGGASSQSVASAPQTAASATNAVTANDNKGNNNVFGKTNVSSTALQGDTARFRKLNDIIR